VRTLAQTILAALYADETEEVFLLLATVSLADATVALRVVNNPEDITSNSNVFTASNFELVLPSYSDSDTGAATILLENIGQTLIASIRSESDPMTVSIDLIVASDPDTALAGPWNFTIRKVSYNLTSIRADLEHDSYLDEPYPVGDFTPNTTPGLFKAVASLPV
jgi:hypothetical protein